MLIEKFQNMSTTKNATEFIASLKQVVDFDEVKSDHAFDRSIMNLSKQLTLSGMPQAFPAIQLMMAAQEDGSNVDHKINLEFEFDLSDHIEGLKTCFADTIRQKFKVDTYQTGNIDLKTDCINDKIHVTITGVGTNKAKTIELRKLKCARNATRHPRIAALAITRIKCARNATKMNLRITALAITRIKYASCNIQIAILR